MTKTKKATNQCGQKNTCESANINLHNSIWSKTLEKSFGDAHPAVTVTASGLISPSHNPELLKTVVQYLMDASVILRANNNQFLADSATELAAQMKNQFGIS